MESHGNGNTGLRWKFAVLPNDFDSSVDVFNGSTRARKISRPHFERRI
jgi:hypothetical protein